MPSLVHFLGASWDEDLQALVTPIIPCLTIFRWSVSCPLLLDTNSVIYYVLVYHETSNEFVLYHRAIRHIIPDWLRTKKQEMISTKEVVLIDPSVQKVQDLIFPQLLTFVKFKSRLPFILNLDIFTSLCLVIVNSSC